MSKSAIFAAGCFWGIEEKFLSTDGVIETEVGYIGGKTPSPSYQDVCEGNTNHAEAVRVHYNEEEITYDNLLDIFFDIHDPTQLNRQDLDFGTQYRSSIFVLDDLSSRVCFPTCAAPGQLNWESAGLKLRRFQVRILVAALLPGAPSLPTPSIGCGDLL